MTIRVRQVGRWANAPSPMTAHDGTKVYLSGLANRVSVE